MTKTNKTVTVTLMAAMFAFGGLVPAVHVDPVASNDSGQFIIRIFPNIDLGIVVDTPVSTTSDAIQRFTITVTAVSGTTN